MDTPKLSTMVVLYTMNFKVNTDKLLSNLPLNDSIIKIEKRGSLIRGESSRDKIKRRSTKESSTNTTGFGHNSITVVLMNDGDGSLKKKEITVKIFQNGVFHLTGVLDPLYDVHTMDYLVKTIWDSCSDCLVDGPSNPEILLRRVVLMNYTTEFNPKTTVPRESLCRNIRALQNPDILVSYDPDVYPGVKIQFISSKWTAKVFRTGKLILTGITSKEDCLKFSEDLEVLFNKTLPSK